MKAFGNSLLLVRFVCSCVMLAALYLCLGAPLYAQTSCSVGDGGTNPNRGKGDDIQCRINNLLTSNQNLLNTVKNNTNNCTGPHCDLVMDLVNRAQNDHDRAMRANGRMKGSDYDDLNTVRKEKCTGKRSDCAAGNGTMYTGGDTDPTIGSDTADQLDEATNALDKANQMLQSDPSPAQGAAVMTSPPPTFEALYEFSTDSNYPKWLHVVQAAGGDPESQLLTGIRFAVHRAELALEAVKDVTEDACKETLVAAGEGGNTSLACVALTVAWAAALSLDDLFDFSDKNQTTWEAHGAYMREVNLNDNLGQVDKDVAAIGVVEGNTQVAINQLQAQVAALQVSINALQAQLANTTYLLSQKSNVSTDMDKQIMQLLLSPDGGRSLPASLLTCTGDSSTSSPCPPVAITCSATTGLCSFSPH